MLRRGFDPYIVKALMSELEQHGPELHAACSPKSLERDAATGKISLTVVRDGKEEVRGPLAAPPPATRPCLAHTHAPLTCHHTLQIIGGFDAVLSAIGRKPVTDALQLAKAGVKVDGQGLVQVDAYENTSAPGVFALGDCTTTGFELTPVAIAAGRRLADRLFGGEPRARTPTLTYP